MPINRFFLICKFTCSHPKFIGFPAKLLRKSAIISPSS
ncbi:hypothetical protein MNBD_ALPHA11-1171 [hydrothermal vent metagenome]|uniref:Uncharacterized protein n=1 Tax=hydrothermal vent metagenome TaxID=652676 RepID=A0A3B0UIE8_9ZZZZ